VALHQLAQRLFEAYEGERSTRGDFTTRDPTGTDARGHVNMGGRPRRWTELPIAEQDCWIAAARAVP
jgi:hypothetical protein